MNKVWYRRRMRKRRARYTRVTMRQFEARKRMLSYWFYHGWHLHPDLGWSRQEATQDEFGLTQ